MNHIIIIVIIHEFHGNTSLKQNFRAAVDIVDICPLTNLKAHCKHSTMLMMIQIHSVSGNHSHYSTHEMTQNKNCSATYLELTANWRANVSQVFHEVGHHVNDTFLLVSATVTNLLQFRLDALQRYLLTTSHLTCQQQHLVVKYKCQTDQWWRRKMMHMCSERCNFHSCVHRLLILLGANSFPCNWMLRLSAMIQYVSLAAASPSFCLTSPFCQLTLFRMSPPNFSSQKSIWDC